MTILYKGKAKIIVTILVLVLALSACGSNQASQGTTASVNPSGDAKTDIITEDINSTKEEATGHTDELGLQMPALSEEELVGTYDPNDVSIRLTDLIYRLGIEIDESKDEYIYVTEVGDGVYRENKWDVHEGDEALLNPPGVGDTYHVNQYDSSGKKVMVINMQSFNAGVECIGIDVYEYKRNGEIKTRYRFVYDDYEWEYILQHIYIYNGKRAVSQATFDLNTHKRTKVEIYAVDSNMTVKEIICDENGNFEYYYTYEYNTSRRATKISKYDLNDNLEYFITREYDGDGPLIETKRYNPSGDLESRTIYIWDEEFDYFNYETYDSDGNLINSGRQ